jgi:hypothetical protein
VDLLRPARDQPLPDKRPKSSAGLRCQVAAGSICWLAWPAPARPFSSIAGRFGNAGQADYSAANDLLCKAMSALPHARGARGIAIDWTAWAEIGMAARGSIPAIMKQAGIDMLPPVAGIPVVRRELGAGTQGEVVVASALGAMLHERAPAGGLDISALAAQAPGLLRIARVVAP